MRTPALALALAACAVPARAFFFNAAAKQTFGKHDYRGVGAWADFGGDLHLRPSVQTYRSDLSRGDFVSYGARLGYDLPVLGLGVSAGAVPEVDGYSNASVGADAVLSLSPSGSGPTRRIKGSDQGGGKARGKGLARVDLSAGVTYTGHKDELDASRGVRPSALRVGQTDLNAGVGVSFLSNLISADFTQSEYDKSFSGLAARGGRFVVVQGVGPVLDEYPETNLHLKAELGMTPVLHPFVGYSRTTFEQGGSRLHAYTAGAYAELMILELTAYYQLLARAGADDQDFYGLGAAVRF